jgi:transcriptional regulator with XRE-family HTH domain
MRNNRSSTPTAGLLADARLRANLSQRELAKRAGTSCSAVANYESGKVDPTVGTLERIIAACGMELRMEAVELTAADIEQYTLDASISTADAYAMAESLRRCVVKIS